MEPNELIDAIEFTYGRKLAWPLLTQGQALYRGLCYKVKHKQPLSPKLLTYIDKCQQQYGGGVTKKRYNIARALATCATEATIRPEKYQNEFDQVGSRLSDGSLSECAETQGEEWVWGCIQSFLRSETDWQNKIEVSVALYVNELDAKEPESDVHARQNLDSGKTGILAKLILDVTKAGSGVAPHPIDAFAQVRANFRASIADGWKAALEQSRANSGDTTSLFFGRWRLLREGGVPFESVGGRSASGAAALGWYHAIRGTKPDDELIVLAEIDPKQPAAGQLLEVKGIPEKVRAIAKSGRFDTIAVVGRDGRGTGQNPDNCEEAVSALRVEKHLGAIRVVDLAANNKVYPEPASTIPQGRKPLQ